SGRETRGSRSVRSKGTSAHDRAVRRAVWFYDRIGASCDVILGVFSTLTFLKNMKRLFLVACLLFAAVEISAQSSLPKGLTVNGVSLDAGYAEVTWKLSRPTRVVTTSKVNECIGAR